MRDHRRLDFANEKPMKEVDIYGYVRNDPLEGNTTSHQMEDNSKNRYSIIAAVILKTGNVNAVKYVIFEDTLVFFEFCSYPSREGYSKRGDIFVIDNYSIQLNGETVDIQEDFCHARYFHDNLTSGPP